MPNSELLTSIPDPTRTIEGLRDTGYFFETAVADLVDNSIAAQATSIYIQVLMDNVGQVSLAVIDNGIGMDKDGIISAMQYGSPKSVDPESLGKYGLGLKTASTAFSRKVSLISRSSATDPAFMATWDLDIVKEKNKWALQVSDSPNEFAMELLNKYSKNNSGTVVLWERVDRLIRDFKDPTGKYAKAALDRQRNTLIEHLAMTFQRFLDKLDNRARNLDISVNGEKLVPWDPFQKDYSKLVLKKELKINESPSEVQVKGYILPRREEFDNKEAVKLAKLSSDNQGIYIYRNNRLLHSATWLGMFRKEPHFTLVRVEFSFDQSLDEFFYLDVKKSQVILNDEIWTWFKEEFLPPLRREAESRYRKGENKIVKGQSDLAHDMSNMTISSKEDEIPSANITDPNYKTQEVTLTNTHGTFKKFSFEDCTC